MSIATMKYDIIYADPPFGAMKIEDMCKINIPACENALLFLKTPSKFLLEGFKLLNAWQFNYITSLCWIEDENDGKDAMEPWFLTYKLKKEWSLNKLSNGSSLLCDNHRKECGKENIKVNLLLLGRKGEFSPPPPRRRPVSVCVTPIEADKGKKIVLNIFIKGMYPDRSIFDLFERNGGEN